MGSHDLSDQSAFKSMGLHRLKDEFNTKTHMADCARFITRHLDSILATTRREAPKRSQATVFDRVEIPTIDQSERERTWEFAISRRWRNLPCMVAGAWWKIVAYQVPLFDQQRKNGWGYIDLLGCTAEFEPCVIELKKEPSVDEKSGADGTETPLRMILEAATYAIALREHWDFYSSHWWPAMQTIGASPQVHTTPINFHLVAAAPAGFWLEWSPWTARGRNKLTDECWHALHELCDILRTHGYPVHFVSLSGSPESPNTLAVQPLRLF